MKPILTIAALLSVVVAPLSAQSIGVKAGGSFSRFEIKSAPTQDPNDLVRNENVDRLAAFGGSLFMQLGRGPIVLQPELMLFAKGARFKDPTTADNDVKLKLNYLEVPVEVLVRTKLGPYAFAGPSIAFEMNCLSEVKQGPLTVSSRCTSTNAPVESRRRFDFNVHAGAGYQYRFGRHIIMLEARQMWGLRDIDNDPNDEVRNSSFAILLGYTSAPGARRGRP